jgi:hypothetical protein
MLQSGNVQRTQRTAPEGQFRFRCPQPNCIQQKSSAERLKGLYLRGKIYWFAHGTGKNRLQESMENSDEAEAIKKAKLILENPELNPCNGFLREMNRYADEKVSDGPRTGNSHISKTSVLKMFGEDLGFKDLPDITTLVGVESGDKRQLALALMVVDAPLTRTLTTRWSGAVIL